MNFARRGRRSPLTLSAFAGAPYDFLPTIKQAQFRDAPDGEGNTVQVSAGFTDVPRVSVLPPIMDGEGNQIGAGKWWFDGSGVTLSYDAWALGKALSDKGATPSPDDYDWIILGEYAMPGRRQWIFEQLRTVGQAAGIPDSYDWTRCLAVASRQHWEQTGQPFRWLETPAIAPVHGAIACAASEFPTLAPFIDATGPNSEIWRVTLQAANERRDAHKDVSKSLTTMVVMAIATMGAAAFMAPAAGAAGGAGASAGGAGAAAAGGTTATVSGAELAALVEAGTVGVEGAFLEAAALSGGTVTYSTATGALLNAALPGGSVVNFDAAADPFAQMGVETGAPADVAMPDTAGAEGAELPPELETLPPSEQNILQEVAQELGVQEIIGDAGKAVVNRLVQMGQSALANEVMQAIGGSAPQSVARPAQLPYSPADDFGPTGYGDPIALQSAGFSGTLAKGMKPLAIGAALASLALIAFPLDDDDNRKRKRRHV